MGSRKRTYNVRRIKATWPYTVQEIAALLGIHKNAVLRWLYDGLQADRTSRPFLIRGDELIRFLTVRQQGRKKKCGPTEFYCCRCRTPRRSYLDIVDLIFESPSRVRLKGICAVCDAPVNKVQSTARLEKIKELFNVQTLEKQNLMGCSTSSVNGDLEGEKCLP